MDNVLLWIGIGLVSCLAIDTYKFHLRINKEKRRYNARLKRLAEMLNKADRDRTEGGRK